MDLKSAHGTFMDKVRLAPHIPAEWKARPVSIICGDSCHPTLAFCAWKAKATTRETPKRASFCFFVPASLSLSIYYLSFFLEFLSLSLSLSLCLCLSLSLSLVCPLSLSLSLVCPLPLSLSLSLVCPLSLSLFLGVFSLYLFFCCLLSLSLSISLSLSLSLSFVLSLSLSLSLSDP